MRHLAAMLLWAGGGDPVDLKQAQSERPTIMAFGLIVTVAGGFVGFAVAATVSIWTGVSLAIAFFLMGLPWWAFFISIEHVMQKLIPQKNTTALLLSLGARVALILVVAFNVTGPIQQVIYADDINRKLDVIALATLKKDRNDNKNSLKTALETDNDTIKAARGEIADASDKAAAARGSYLSLCESEPGARCTLRGRPTCSAACLSAHLQFVHLNVRYHRVGQRNKDVIKAAQADVTVQKQLWQAANAADTLPKIKAGQGPIERQHAFDEVLKEHPDVKSHIRLFFFAMLLIDALASALKFIWVVVVGSSVEEHARARRLTETSEARELTFHAAFKAALFEARLKEFVAIADKVAKEEASAYLNLSRAHLHGGAEGGELKLPTVYPPADVVRPLRPTDADAEKRDLQEQIRRAKQANDALTKLMPLLKGRYRVVCSLDRGSFAEVLLARDERATEGESDFVALKTRRDDVKEPKTGRPISKEKIDRQLRSEWNKLRSLDHPNVVGVRECFEEGGRVYIVMNYIDGRTLREELARRPRPLEAAEAVGYLEPICQGVAAAHAVGILHLDISPGNVMVDDQGGTWVTDFGISTRMGRIMQTSVGTRGYASYEQATGGELSEASDVYSICAVGWHMLTGHKLVTGDPESGGTPVAPSVGALLALAPQVPQSLAEVLVKGLSLHQPERWQTVEELRRELVAALRATDSGRGTLRSVVDPEADTETLLPGEYPDELRGADEPDI